MQCGTLVSDGTARCDAHKLKAWTKYSSAPERRRGRALQRDRAALFSREPLCRECSKHGRLAAAVIRDHIVNLAEGGTDTDDNVQPLCQSCSDIKTQAESRRGRGP